MLARAGLYWRTLRHLRPAQWVGRARLMLPKRRVVSVGVAPTRRQAAGRWIDPIALAPTMIGPAAFCFIGHDGGLSAAGGWDDPATEKLWRYNLHYFNDLNAVGGGERAAWHLALVNRWIAENPVGLGTGWEPYPTSLRIVNWVKREQVSHILNEAALASLATQARSLAGRLEWHLFGNHLFANAKALIFAGAFFAGKEADRWRATGLAIVRRELHEQVLADGGNFELSPMYHAIFAEDLLDLLNVAARWPATVPDDLVVDLRDTVRRMLDWAQAMTFPDGDIALFNDAAIGIAPTAAQLLEYASRFGIDVPASSGIRRHLKASGYVRAEAGDAVLIADVARVGPDYLPGHAHADTLSFEFALDVHRVVVNGGTSRYGTGARRSFERSTAAHSTVEVAGQDSSEMWGGFRVGARAYPHDVSIVERDGTAILSAMHDGYARLPGKPVHRREWTLRGGRLTVVDTVVPEAPAVARFILSPDIVPVQNGSGWRLRAGDREIAVAVQDGSATLAPASYAPRFGEPIDTQALEVVLTQGRSQVEFLWEPA